MAPLHFQDQNGQWQEIDTTLENSTGETDEDGDSFGYQVVKNTFRSYLPRHSKGWVELRTGDCRLAFKLMTGNNEKRPFNTTIHGIYTKNPLNQCDINLTVKNGGIKEDIILKDQTAPQVFTYQIRLHNLSISKSDTGDIQFTDNQGNTTFIMPKFFMYDANNNYSEDIQANIEQHGNSYMLTIKPNPQWLSNSDRTYPVTIDPTTVNIQGLGGDPSGSGRLLYYMPAIGFINATSDPSYSQSFSSGATVGINHWNRLFNIPNLLPYPVKIQYTAVSQGTSAPWYGSNDGLFKINYWNPNAQNDDDSNVTSCLHSYTFHANIQNDTDTGAFILQPGQAVRFELTNPIWARLFWMSTWAGNCTLTIQCPKESMSPKPTQVDPLPPETPGSTVALHWVPAIGDWNQDAWNLPLYASVRPIPAELCKAGQVVGYKVQYATDASFTTPQNFTGAVTLDSNTGEYTCSITGLAQNSTYYFRVCGIDAEGNPTNMRSWDDLNNPSGPRWSNIAVTKCIAPLPSGVPAKPAIADINPKYQVAGEPDRYYCNSQSATITWTPAQTGARICFTDQTSLTNSYFTINNSSNSFTIPQLTDGNYLVYVQTINSAGSSPWSDPWKLTMDMTPPTLSAITETVNNGDVKLKFSSSEPVQVNIYWDLSPTPLAISPTNYIQYDGTDSGGTIDLGYLCTDATTPHFYRLDVTDKAQNTYSTGTVQLGNGTGNNVANTDKNFGLEKYCDFQTIDLGKAGTANVNLNNGDLILSATDFSIPSRGIPLTMSRFYSSLTDYQGMLGKGWRSSFEMYLTNSGQDVIINDPDGSSHKFIHTGSGFTRPNGDYRRIILNTDQSYTVLETSGLKYNFGAPQNGTCRLNSVVDRFGNTLTLNYDGAGFLTSVAEPSGRITATLEYNYYDPVSGRNLLSAIRFTPLESGATSSRYVTFNYQNGKLAEVRYPASGGNSEIAVDYTYDSVVGLLSSARVCLMNGGRNKATAARMIPYSAISRSNAPLA